MIDKVFPRFKTFPARKQPKRKRDGNDASYLAKIRLLPCCVCGAPPPTTVHHLKAGTGTRGISMRSTDKFGVPLCMYWGEDCHTEVERQGSKREHEWFMKHGIHALHLADCLWRNKHSLEAMRAVLAAHRGKDA